MAYHWHKWSWRNIFLMGLVCLLGATGCSSEPEGKLADHYGVGVLELDEFGKPVLDPTDWVEPAGKEDAIRGSQGLPVSVDNSDTSVWEVKNAWQDRDTPAAREAGIAWGENSGLTWEQKFEAWVSSMAKIDRPSYGKTFMLTTPWGVELAAPALECAELAMFLRVAFASWYHLPFFMEARDADRNRLYVGHFGFRTAYGRHGNTPRFRNLYRDYSHLAEAIKNGEAEWPSDSQLAERKIPGSFDDAQPMLGDGAHAGAYFDRIFLNKRVGYFLLVQLMYFGSVNLADSTNTFNVKPEGVQAGDMLIHRWQRNGIGHVMVVMRSRTLGTQEIDGEVLPQMEAEIASGSMPRRQPLWESPAQSKRSFTRDVAGGGEYRALGGGLRRFRAATNVGGRWTNVVPAQYSDDFINSTAQNTLAARVDRFEQILTELTGAEKLNALAESIEAQRAHLRNYPASCAARTRREDTFKELYRVAEDLGMTKEEVDREFRRFEDYVFAELVYSRSKTCCWNSSTADMYDIAIEYNLNRIEDPETGQCQDIAVFMNRDDDGDGYELFRDYARQVGREGQWVNWSADESCPQAQVAEDTQANHGWSPICSIYDSIQF